MAIQFTTVEGVPGYITQGTSFTSAQSNLSFSCWFKITTADTGLALVDYFATVAPPYPAKYYGYRIAVSFESSLGEMWGNVYVGLGTPSSVVLEIDPVASFDTSIWHHLAFTWDKNRDPSAEVYIDGVFVSSGAMGTGSDIAYAANITQHLYGGTQPGVDAPIDYLAEVTEWEVTLTLAEIQQLYAGGMIVHPMPQALRRYVGLLFYLPMNDDGDGMVAQYPRDYRGRGGGDGTGGENCFFRAAPVATLGGAPVLIE